MRTNTITIIALSAVMVSCQDLFQEKGVFTESQEIEITATFAEGSTKTVLSDNEKSVLWSPNDTIAVFYGKYAKGRFMSQNSEPEAMVKFKGRFTNYVDYLNPSNLFFGLYPYDENAECDGETVTAKIPTMQYAVPGTFARGMFPTVAVSENLSLAFWSVCGGVCFTLSKSDINKVEITSNNGEAIAGKIRLSFREDGTPSAEVINGASGVTIAPQTGDCFMSGQLYFASLLPADLSGGLTISFYTSSWQRGSYRISEPVTVKRSVFGKLTEKDKNCEWSNVESDLSSDGTANCYLVSRAGAYKFKAEVRGGSEIPVGNVAKAEAIWESFGTAEIPYVGDLVRTISYKDGYVHFSTPPSLRNGNALIAVKDESGTILWSWHIWICDGFDPFLTEQVYYNDAGTMMDRNLGATSATPGDVGALGLLYQYGRKDPFLTSCSISSDWELSASTLKYWPEPVFAEESEDFTISHPTTKVGISEHPGWPSSSIEKGVHDPCPQGWRIPDGGNIGVWAKALGTTIPILFEVPWDNINRGMNFGSENGFPKSRQLGDSPTIWYPAAGRIGNGVSVRPMNTGEDGFYWSAGSYNDFPDFLISDDMYGDGTHDDPMIYPAAGASRNNCLSVRCVRETLSPSPQQPSLPEDALVGAFSIAPDRKVHFSKGNLTYDVPTTTWKFYEHQYDCATAYDANLISLFTWGYDATNSIDPDGIAYVEGHITESEKNLSKSDDWGNVFGGESSIWRTLTTAEWQYLFTHHSYRWAAVNGVNGYVIAPDGFKGSLSSSYKDDAALAADNLVFLPAAGCRYGSNVSDIGDIGDYWSSTAIGGFANSVFFNSDHVSPGLSDSRSNGYSVRLVTEPGHVSVSGVSISSTSLSLTVGETAKLSATVSPSTATDKKVIWSSDNTSAVTIDNDGNVCAIGAGNATITVTTLDGGKTATCTVTVKPLPEGALHGRFSISDKKQVHFSKGNLTCDISGATPDWKFYEHQYDCATGYDATLISFFTWGYDATKSIDPDGTEFVSGHDTDDESFDSTEDWGTQIGDGNTWRTLSIAEWQYLFSYDGSSSGGQNYDNDTRRDKYKYGVTVCGKANCVVLLPDGWKWEGAVGTAWQSEYNETSTTVKWSTMEAAGAVCLPAAGYRHDPNVRNVGDGGSYWSSTSHVGSSAFLVSFDSSVVYPGNLDYRYFGFSVRLVTESK